MVGGFCDVGVNIALELGAAGSSGVQVWIGVSQFDQLAFGFLHNAGNLARVANVLVSVELDAEFNGLVAEQIGVDVPVLGSPERSPV